MGQLCSAMTEAAENENLQTRALNGRPAKCFSGHATRDTAAQCSYMMPTLSRMIEKKPALRILDVGCGSGSITVDLALKAPRGQVVGLDLFDLETAKAHALNEGVNNVTFVKGNVHKLPFATASFDVVHAHQSVSHFRNHAMAIKEMIRVTKKGGALCMREGDLSTARFYPHSPVLEECFQLIMEVHKLNGGTTDAGAKLEEWTVDAGVSRSNVIVTQSTCKYSTLKERRDYGEHWPARCTYGAFADLAIQMGAER